MLAVLGFERERISHFNPGEAGDTFRFLPGERDTLVARSTAHATALRGLVIAIDGPAGSGKSTTARGVANRLGLRHLDTGALYRAVTWAGLRDGIDGVDEAALGRLVQAAPLGVSCSPAGQTVTVGDDDITAAIRTPAVTALVSQVSAWPAVREAMLGLQRRLARLGGTVMEGRDIGTVVLPDADLKIFLTADVATRAARRQREDAAGGSVRPQAAVEDEIRARDHADSTRASAPLQRAPGAVVLDTTALGIDDQIHAVVALALRLGQERARIRIFALRWSLSPIVTTSSGILSRFPSVSRPSALTATAAATASATFGFSKRQNASALTTTSFFGCRVGRNFPCSINAVGGPTDGQTSLGSHSRWVHRQVCK